MHFAKASLVSLLSRRALQRRICEASWGFYSGRGITWGPAKKITWGPAHKVGSLRDPQKRSLSQGRGWVGWDKGGGAGTREGWVGWVGGYGWGGWAGTREGGWGGLVQGKGRGNKGKGGWGGLVRGAQGKGWVAWMTAAARGGG